MKKTTDPFRQVLDDTPENREAMFHSLLGFDEPFHAPGMQRRGMPFFLGVTRNGKLAFMTGSDAKDSFVFVIGEWTPWSGVKRVDLPIHEIRWVKHI
jgi:hypothetical protein